MSLTRCSRLRIRCLILAFFRFSRSRWTRRGRAAKSVCFCFRWAALLRALDRARLLVRLLPPRWRGLARWTGFPPAAVEADVEALDCLARAFLSFSRRRTFPRALRVERRALRRVDTPGRPPIPFPFLLGLGSDAARLSESSESSESSDEWSCRLLFRDFGNGGGWGVNF